jgi:predicted GIY-YIG superfamily endonuclease
LKELLTRAKFGDNMDMLPPKTRDNLKMKIKATSKYNIHYDKSQLTAPIKHAQHTCKCGWSELTDSHNNLQEAIDSIQICPRTLPEQDQPTHQIRTIPVTVTRSVTTHCNECKFIFQLKTNISMQDIEQQIRLAVLINNRRLSNLTRNIERCNYKCCVTCKAAYRGNPITTYHNDKIMPLTFKCNQTNVIYAIICLKCNKWYVGYTTRSLKERLAIHKSSIKRKDKTAISTHFNTHGHAIHAHLRVTILDQAKTRSDLIIKEAIWIDKMDLINHGINERDEAAAYLHSDINLIARHFNHSDTCFPHFTSTINSVLYNPLTHYRKKAK